MLGALSKGFKKGVNTIQLAPWYSRAACGAVHQCFL